MISFKTFIRQIINGKFANAILLVHETFDESGMNLSTPLKWEFFEDLCHRYKEKIVSLKDLLENSNLKHRYALTFDDGLLDTFERAYPFLKSLGIPFTIFLTVDLIGKTGYMNQKQVKEIASDPLVTIGSHGYTHSVMNNKNIKHEVVDSKIELEKISGQHINMIAYPYGQSTRKVRKMAKKIYKYGFGVMNFGVSNKTKWFKMRIPRYSFETSKYNRQIRLIEEMNRGK